MIQDSKEIHLFIVWSKGLAQSEDILSDIGKNFKLVQEVTVGWSAKKFSENLSRFYGENLPKNSSKEKHCGTGPFLCVIVSDENPVYDLRETSKGIKAVNTNTFDAKQRYRTLTGGGHRIHGTDNVEEAKHNLYMLFGTPYANWQGEGSVNLQNPYNHDLIGANGWSSLDEIFRAFNELCNYVVIRNFENMEEELKNLHPDIDILTNDKRLIKDVSNGTKTYKNKYRVQHKVLIGSKEVFFDFRYIGDNYYDYRWEQQILKDRVMYRNFYVPDATNHFYTLMYHAFIHKEALSEDYVHKLNQLSKEIGLDYNITHFLNFKLLEDLNSFMNSHLYAYVEPNDLTVYHNRSRIQRFGDLEWSGERASYESVRSLKSIIKKIIRKFQGLLGRQA